MTISVQQSDETELHHDARGEQGSRSHQGGLVEIGAGQSRIGLLFVADVTDEVQRHAGNANDEEYPHHAAKEVECSG